MYIELKATPNITLTAREIDKGRATPSTTFAETVFDDFGATNLYRTATNIRSTENIMGKLDTRKKCW